MVMYDRIWPKPYICLIVLQIITLKLAYIAILMLMLFWCWMWSMRQAWLSCRWSGFFRLIGEMNKQYTLPVINIITKPKGIGNMCFVNPLTRRDMSYPWCVKWMSSIFWLTCWTDDHSLLCYSVVYRITVHFDGVVRGSSGDMNTDWL